MNKDEYIIINKTAIEKGIAEWNAELQEYFKAPVGKFNSDQVSTLQQAIATAREILSQSIPLISEIEKAFDAGDRYRYWENNDSRNIPSHIIDKEDYISNLKLDI